DVIGHPALAEPVAHLAIDGGEDGRQVVARQDGRDFGQRRHQALRRKQVLSTRSRILSEWPSMCSGSSSTRRMLRIIVPCFSGTELPRTLRSLITTTVSPCSSGLPLQSRTTVSFSVAPSPGAHSCPQSVQENSVPSDQVLSLPQAGQS